MVQNPTSTWFRLSVRGTAGFLTCRAPKRGVFDLPFAGTAWLDRLSRWNVWRLYVFEDALLLDTFRHASNHPDCVPMIIPYNKLQTLAFEPFDPHPRPRNDEPQNLFPCVSLTVWVYRWSWICLAESLEVPISRVSNDRILWASLVWCFKAKLVTMDVSI